MIDNIRKEILNKSKYVEAKKDIIIVAHNQIEYLRRCIDSIFINTSEFNIYLWDNASDHNLKEVFRDYPINVFRSEDNLGFIIPNNELLKKAVSPYVILLNSDCIVFKGWDKALLGWLQNENDVLVGYMGGILNEELIGVKSAFGRTPDYICGWCMAFERSTYQEFGLFDQDNLTFAYAEDADLSLRLKEKGKSIYALSLNLVHHYGHKTIEEVHKKRDTVKTFKENHEYLKKRWGVFLRK